MSDTSRKTIDFIIEAAKLTSETLKEVLRAYLQKDEAVKSVGKTRYGKLAKSGKLDSIEVTDNNIKDFLSVAKKHDVDFALKRDRLSNPPKYHVFFTANDSESFNRAFKEYAFKSEKKLNRAVISREQVKESSRIISRQNKHEVSKGKNKQRQRNKGELKR